ncbi:MAG: FAD-binding oxidoreductase [Pseudomonadota bacterium]
MKTVDVIVLGAGMAGVSAALHLQERGRQVVVVDRQAPGEGTSYGNAGVIETDGFEPVTFPSDLRSLVRYALNRESDVSYHLATLLRIAPWLNRLRQQSSRDGIAQYRDIMKPLITSAGKAHEHLASRAGASGHYRNTGWIKMFRRPSSKKAAELMAAAAAETGNPCQSLTPDELAELEPHVAPVAHTALFFPSTRSVSSPGGVTKAFAQAFAADGGTIAIGDAASLTQSAEDGWQVETVDGPISAPDVVVALGPWAKDLVARFGYQLPLEVKRGYHRHFSAKGNASLSRPIVDIDNGYALAPMQDGIRMTSGIEFAERDADPTPVQLSRALPRAQALFPLDQPVEAEPWMGARPCTPDSMPILGRAPNHEGLWFSFGHGHWGFSQGPITGRLVAEAIVGETPSVDIGPLGAGRFL